MFAELSQKIQDDCINLEAKLMLSVLIVYFIARRLLKIKLRTDQIVQKQTIKQRVMKLYDVDLATGNEKKKLD